ncbi:hypothetical protein QBC44DRAFT_331858 [Cladorrhinum sp. PSN332]|nr:hypothetical protein QBC44DRAFT_331858 [Cladorrhinum sp. PSN332]
MAKTEAVFVPSALAREQQVCWPPIKEYLIKKPNAGSAPYALCPICYEELDVAGVPALEGSESGAVRVPGVVLACGHMMCTGCWQTYAGHGRENNESRPGVLSRNVDRPSSNYNAGRQRPPSRAATLRYRVWRGYERRYSSRTESPDEEGGSHAAEPQFTGSDSEFWERDLSAMTLSPSHNSEASSGLTALDSVPSVMASAGNNHQASATTATTPPRRGAVRFDVLPYIRHHQALNLLLAAVDPLDGMESDEEDSVLSEMHLSELTARYNIPNRRQKQPKQCPLRCSLRFEICGCIIPPFQIPGPASGCTGDYAVVGGGCCLARIPLTVPECRGKDTTTTDEGNIKLKATVPPSCQHCTSLAVQDRSKIKNVISQIRHKLPMSVRDLEAFFVGATRQTGISPDVGVEIIKCMFECKSARRLLLGRGHDDSGDLWEEFAGILAIELPERLRRKFLLDGPSWGGFREGRLRSCSVPFLACQCTGKRMQAE